jgi:hypothetical protein
MARPNPRGSRRARTAIPAVEGEATCSHTGILGHPQERQHHTGAVEGICVPVKGSINLQSRCWRW